MRFTKQKFNRKDQTTMNKYTVVHTQQELQRMIKSCKSTLNQMFYNRSERIEIENYLDELQAALKNKLEENKNKKEAM